jgi:Carboxypeptidase regulatory-like domain
LNRLKKALLYLTFFAILIPFCASFATGQDTTGRITGVIYDQTGAVIAGAHITVTNVATQSSRNTTSDSAGLYQVPLLPIGYYTVSADHQGFRSVANWLALSVPQLAQPERLIACGTLPRCLASPLH